MEVVRRNVELLRGTIAVDSEPGAGTTVSIRLPLTLAILDGMSVSVGGEIFILPLGYVIESLQPAVDDVKSIAGSSRVLRVRGDSMIDEQIRDGDFVVVEDRKTAENGEMVIALLRGSDVTLKKFYRDPGGKIRLQPANAAMQPIFADPDQVQVQGVVVGVMRKY